ncbi:MAG: glycosyltransferase [Blautia sp.]|uniref:glycosyltransferase family 2 protein n=1 Tax=Blautia sp. TaxID=1955243 RepID=UPI002E79EC35|nr:glycosyltransferase [Blautia sp.]MED9881041.1 glycosyltransferase [Blautia sp.]
MKLLSIAIPCYNSEAYMEKCIDSLLIGGEDVEILIVNDGSSDRTAEIADSYERKYPTIVKAIHQENGGHGEAVNAGIRNATGLYFKVVDSDDWVNAEAYAQILKTLGDLIRGPETVDLLISNFVYEKQGARRKRVMQYRHCLPVNEIFGWEKVHMHKGKYLLMHSMIYRTKLLHECGIQLPKYTFYVDNIFAFEPLPYVKKMYYLDVNFYRYFIGRDDQSVNEKVMIKRIDQQLRVNKIMVDVFHRIKFNNRRHLRKYMLSYLEIITTISSVMLIRAETQEALDKKKELMEYIREEDRRIYHRLRWGIMGCASNLPGKGGRKTFIAAYKLCQKFYGFN